VRGNVSGRFSSRGCTAIGGSEGGGSRNKGQNAKRAAGKDR